MGENGVFVFPDAGVSKAASTLDPNLLLALNQNGGFGNNGNWIWILFLWMMYGYGGNGFGGFGNGNGTGFLANQLNNDAGRDLILQALNGRADALSQIAGITNSSVDAVRTVLGQIQLGIQQATSQVGLSGLETINALQLGNAGLSRQICECCCENRLAIANQTNDIQTSLAANHAAATLQAAQNQAALQLQNAQSEAADQLSVCQQTNQLTNQGTANTQRIVDALANQSTMITKEFCDLKERELQNKIESLTADNALLRSNINNSNQTAQVAAMIAPLQAQINNIAAKQPATITLPQNQYAVVPAWYAQAGTDFIASYWANRTSQATSGSGAAAAGTQTTTNS